MTLDVKHATVVVVADDGTSPVGTDEWNASHTVSMATDRILGRITASAGAVEELTGTQATTLFDPFTSTLKGLAPASGGGTTNFLRADGSWVTPGGSGSPGGANTQIQYNDSGSFGGDAGLVYDKTNDTLTGVSAVFTAINPHAINNNTDAQSIRINTTYNDGIFDYVIPQFTNQVSVEIVQATNVGHNTYGGDPFTQGKSTFAPLALTHTARGAGQRFITIRNATYYGGGDAFMDSYSLNFFGGCGDGDEGQSYRAASRITQGGNSATNLRTTIFAVVTPATINTTTTQIITGSQNLQTVTVASSSGVSAGQWVVVEHVGPNAQWQLEAVKIDSVPSGTSIRGRFRNNHASGVTVKPALVLDVSDIGGFGEQRLIVNLSGTSYTTGTVSAISGGGFTGTGTSWSNGMVGGTSPNIGAIALTSDDVTVSPYGSGSNALKSWYQIIDGSVTATGLGVFTTTVAGDASYRGKGVTGGATAYIIRPCARVLQIDGNRVICEPSTHTWTAGDTIECTITPYCDFTGYQESFAVWANGAQMRSWLNIHNQGARKMPVGINIIGNPSAQTGSNGTDEAAFETAIDISDSNHGVLVRAAKTAAFHIHTVNLFGTGGILKETRISWGSISSDFTPRIEFDTNIQGLQWWPINQATISGKLSFHSDTDWGTTANRSPTANASEARWAGHLTLLRLSTQDIFLKFYGTGTSDTYWRMRGTLGDTTATGGGTGIVFEKVVRNGTSGDTVTAALAVGNATVKAFLPLVTDTKTVATLVVPATAGAGARSFVTDATATTFASVVAGGGSNGVPVYSDGTNWRIG
jgi:hypothetical protein